MNTTVNYRLWVVTMCQCRLINCNKCTPLVGNVGNGRLCTWTGMDYYRKHRKSLYLHSVLLWSYNSSKKQRVFLKSIIPYFTINANKAIFLNAFMQQKYLINYFYCFLVWGITFRCTQMNTYSLFLSAHSSMYTEIWSQKEAYRLQWVEQGPPKFMSSRASECNLIWK